MSNHFHTGLQRWICLLTTLATLGIWGCPPPPRDLDWNSGGDETRDQARKLFAGQNVTDSLDDDNGDNTDWKLIRIREPGDLDITVAIDNTRSMNGYVSVKDGFGIELGRRPISAQEGLYTFPGLPVYQGEIYVVVFVDRGSSTYTAGAVFRPSAKPGPASGGVVADPIRTPPRTTGGGGGGGGADTDPPPDTTPTPDTTTPPETDPDDGDSVALRGRIGRFVELENGGSKIYIVGLGSSDGIKAGMTGQIVGLGASFRVTSVGGRSAVGVTSAKAESLGPYKTVVIRVKAGN